MKMLTGVIAIILLSNGQASAKLEIMNIETSHGVFGPVRKSLEIYPLDEVCFRYHVTGVKIGAENKADLELHVQLVNSNGKTVYEQKPTNQKQLSLGSGTFPLFTILTVPPPDKAPAGEYTFSVQVRDRISSETANFERKLTLKPMTFQILTPRFWQDHEGKIPARAGGMVGESLHLKLKVVGFDKSKKKVQTTLTIHILGEDGKEVTEKPQVVRAELNGAEEAAKAIQVNYNSVIYLNRPGNFTLKLTAEDVIGNQTATFETPLIVIAP